MGGATREEAGAGVTFAEALREGSAALRVAGLDDPRREAATILTHATGRDRAFLITHADERLDEGELAGFRRAVARRAAGEPFQYIAGRQEFYGLDFEVTPDVLIPRPETELLVETALELLEGAEAPFFCDVGAGSGCVAVALLCGRPDAGGVALDISPAALAVAARNAERHGVGGRLRLLASDCFGALEAAGPAEERFDMIVSNPPYVAEDEIEGLQREVRDHEPRLALTPGGDGLAVIRRLVAESPRHLRPGGHLLLEIGFGQRERVSALAARGGWTVLGVREDLQGIPRVVALRLDAKRDG